MVDGPCPDPEIYLKISLKHLTFCRCTAHTLVNLKARDTFLERLKHSHHKATKNYPHPIQWPSNLYCT